jgi:hydrogenase expression/formation protein HypC
VCLAIPGQIVELLAERDHLALVDVVGVRRKIDVGLLADENPRPGDWVLIHVGFAMCRISEEDAREQMRILTIMGEEAAALEEASGYGLDGLWAGGAP